MGLSTTDQVFSQRFLLNVRYPFIRFPRSEAKDELSNSMTLGFSLFHGASFQGSKKTIKVVFLLGFATGLLRLDLRGRQKWLTTIYNLFPNQTSLCLFACR
mmetsp:Transcript_19823/g.45226  ORF Transcript_19823/g.45226 Transcript_19823/m.45226 type:complete len:101 (+) Transcript_19823:867-1169(+)